MKVVVKLVNSSLNDFFKENNNSNDGGDKQVSYLQDELQKLETSYNDLQAKYNDLQSHKDMEIMKLNRENIDLTNQITFLKENGTRMMKHAFKQKLSNKLIPIIKTSKNLHINMNQFKYNIKNELSNITYSVVNEFQNILEYIKKFKINQIKYLMII